MSADDQIRVTLQHEEGYRFSIDFEGSGLDAIHTDLPPPNGQGSGPDPEHLLLAALANCLAASLLHALRVNRNPEASGVRAEVSARPARNAEGRLRIPQVFVELQLPGHNDDYQGLDKVLAKFEDFCTVTQSVRKGIDVEVTVRDADQRVLLGDKSFEAGS